MQREKHPNNTHGVLCGVIATCKPSLIDIASDSLYVTFCPGINLKVKKWKTSARVNFTVKSLLRQICGPACIPSLVINILDRF